MAAGIILIGTFLFLQTKPTKVAEEVTTVQRPSIGFILGELYEERWKKEFLLIKYPPAEFLVNVFAKYSSPVIENQLSDLSNLITTNNIRSLIYIPHDSISGDPIVRLAHEHNVKVVDYDRLILNSPVDYYVTHSSVEVGVLSARETLRLMPKGKYVYLGGDPADNNAKLVEEGVMKELAPSIKNGDVSLVFRAVAPDWKAAYTNELLKKFYKNGGDADAIICAYDGIGGGAISVLKELGIKKRVIIGGQDAEVSALQRIADGTQAFTISKPLAPLAAEAVRVAKIYAEGGTPSSTATTNNGYGDIPTSYIPISIVNKDNLEAYLRETGQYDNIMGTTTQR